MIFFSSSIFSLRKEKKDVSGEEKAKLRAKINQLSKDGQPVNYDSIPDFEGYGIGCFILAGTEVYKLD